MEKLNLDLCVVDTTHATIYDFVHEGESNGAALRRAYDAAKRDIDLYERYIIDYPANADYWKKQIDTAKSKVFEILFYDQFKALERERLLSAPMVEISKEDYSYALNILPPLHFCSRHNVEMFCISEMWTGSYTTQYAHNLATGKYYMKMVDACDKSTWICEILESMPA